MEKKKGDSPPLKSILRNKNDKSPLLSSYTNDTYNTKKEEEELADFETSDSSLYNPKAKSVKQYEKTLKMDISPYLMDMEEQKLLNMSKIDY